MTVISVFFTFNGGASAVKEPGHACSKPEKPPARLPGCTFFLKKIDDLF